MKKILVIAAFLLLVFSSAFADNSGNIIVEGHYQAKNIFIKNSFGGSGVGFCVYEITVNGELSTDEINSSAFEIQVLNPDVLKPKSTFITGDITFTKQGVLNWTASNETGALDYIVEQFRWNKWVKVGEVRGDGLPGQHVYSFKVTPHSGTNKARVKQVDYTGKPRFSSTVEYNSDIEAITLEKKTKFKDEILFTNGETLYEVYDKYGSIVKRGFGGKANIQTLEKGTYYLSYDNKTETIAIK